MRLTMTGALIAAALAGTAVAAPSPDLPCASVHGPRLMSLDQAPPSVRLAFLHSLAPQVPPPRLAAMAGSMIVRRDGDWQATDVVSPGSTVPGRRFIAADQAQGRWRIWYETGGIAHLYDLAILEPTAQGWRVAQTLTAGSPAALCRTGDQSR